MGSHRRFQVSRVFSSHSTGVQATVLVAPQFREPRRVAHCVGRPRGDGSDRTDLLARELRGDLVVHGAGPAGAHRAAHPGEHLAELAEHLPELGGIEALRTERVVATTAGKAEAERRPTPAS